MKLVLATGIYPPAIGGPATYVAALARELGSKDIDVQVVSYGNATADPKVTMVPLTGGSLVRWFRYARALKKAAQSADAVIAFSSVSVGVPLILARLKHPKKILRLGGDFFWERYTDRGGMLSLREWYASGGLVTRCSLLVAHFILQRFDHIVFSTEYQKKIYEEFYVGLPMLSVIENTFPTKISSHSMHLLRTSGMKGNVLRLLYFGRFVGFKNLPALITAMKDLPATKLTLVGDGPIKNRLQKQVHELGITDRVEFQPTAHGEEKLKIFAAHDALVISSVTELSSNSALEARAAGLPVLLTRETGLSSALTEGMLLRDLRTPAAITRAVEEVRTNYESIASKAMAELPRRTWNDVASEILTLVSK